MRTQSAGPSATARLIAACTLYLAHDPRFDAFVPPGAATLSKELLLASGFRGRLICLAVRHTLLRRVGAIIESRMLPGVSMHYALRKRWLEDRVREAIGRGATQLLILGAGYDSLGHRLAQEMRELQVLELDQPATQEPKREVVGRLPDLPANLEMQPTDLSPRGIDHCLQAITSIVSSAPTVVVMEGLLMYLDPDVVDALFRCLGTTVPAATVAFTSMGLDDQGHPDFVGMDQRIHSWLRVVREPFTWGIRPADVAAYLSDRGLVLVEQISTHSVYGGSFRTDAVDDPAIAEGEQLYYARSTGRRH